MRYFLTKWLFYGKLLPYFMSPHILIITCQPDAIRTKIGVSREDELGWFESALDLPKNSPQLRFISAADDELPDKIEEQAIIIGGSAHSVYENEPWMRQLQSFIRQRHKAGVPILGICFGSQLLAETFGGKVEKNESGLEAGLVEIQLTDAGKQDPLFDGVKSRFDIYAYHHDAVTQFLNVTNATLLAKNEKCGVQAFAIGKTTRGVQFHPEVGRARIEQALSDRRQSLIDGGHVSEEEYNSLMRDLAVKTFDPVRKQILKNFQTHFARILEPIAM